jgi:hypothetical protein
MTGRTDAPQTCFGFQAVGDPALQLLRFGRGEPLEVGTHTDGAAQPGDRLLLEWKPTTARPFEARLYRARHLYRLWLSDGGWFVVDPDAPSVSLPDGEDPVRREERLWGVPAMLCGLHRGALPLHAASVQLGAGALVLAAPRTAGKSTLAAGFARAGYRVLSEDVTLLRFSPGPSVVPGPAGLRLRRDVAGRLEIPAARVLSEDDDRVHLSFELRGRGDCAPVPVSGLVLLQPPAGDFAVERVPTREALRALWPLAFRLPAQAVVRRCFAMMAELAEAVPVARARYPRSLAELGATVERIAAWAEPHGRDVGPPARA